VIVVRHAEQLAQGTKNPSLSAAGWERGEALREVLSASDVEAVYSADLCRSVQTALPLARATGIPVRVHRFVSMEVDLLDGCIDVPEGTIEFLEEPISSWPDLADLVVERHRGSTALIVGHTTTIPMLLQRLLAIESPGPTIALEVYDDLFVVRIPEGDGVPTLIRAKYGSPATGWSAAVGSP